MELHKFLEEEKRVCDVPLRVGQKVLMWDGGGIEYMIEGVISEVAGNIFYVLHNNPKCGGTIGKIHPSKKGFKYSWAIRITSHLAHIKILEDAEITWQEVYCQ